jgi:hypothetical protein
MLMNGGTLPYNYSWTSLPVQTSSVLINVVANTYTCNVTDGNGCSTSQSVIISEPQALIMAASSFSNISCFGGNNGQISTTVQNGSPGYTYVWTPSIGSSGFVSGLLAGGYSVVVTDAHNCSINASFNITEPSILTSSYASLPATCGNPNGSATVTVNGGTPTYTVTWNTAPLQTGTVATNMAPGTNWLATIQDSKGCILTQSHM